MTDPLKALIAAGRKLDFVLAIGPARMMQAVAETTRPHGIKTVVSLNSLMVDGTGMCGGCRIITTHGAQFACVDGPEFDAHAGRFRPARPAQPDVPEARGRVAPAIPRAPRARCSSEVRESCRLEQKHPEVRCEAAVLMSATSHAAALEQGTGARSPGSTCPSRTPSCSSGGTSRK